MHANSRTLAIHHIDSNQQTISLSLNVIEEKANEKFFSKNQHNGGNPLHRVLNREELNKPILYKYLIK